MPNISKRNIKLCTFEKDPFKMEICIYMCNFDDEENRANFPGAVGFHQRSQQFHPFFRFATLLSFSISLAAIAHSSALLLKLGRVIGRSVKAVERARRNVMNTMWSCEKETKLKIKEILNKSKLCIKTSDSHVGD